MRYLITSFSLLLVLGSLQPSVRAQQVPELINDEQFRPIAQQAVDSLYNYNPDAADSLFAPWRSRHPEHPIWTLIDGMKLWWQILGDLEDESLDQQFFNLMGRADYESGRLLREDPDHADALLARAIANGYIARQKANRGQWIGSVNQARKAYSAYRYLQEVQPDLPDLKLAEGLKLYYAEYLPEAYPIVKTVSWFLPDGDRQEGLAYLQEAADESIFAQAEARYFMGNINMNYEKNYEAAAADLYRLYQTYPRNSYYARILVRSYFKMDSFSRAMTLIEQIRTRWERDDLAFRKVLEYELLTWKGRIYYNRMQFDRAAEYLQQAYELGEQLSVPEKRGLQVMAGYYLGRSYMYLNESAKARRYLEEVSGMEAQQEYRKAARRLIREEF